MMPDKFPVHIKNLVSRNLVKQLLMKGASEPHDIDEPWIDYDKLPMETKCKFQVGGFTKHFLSTNNLYSNSAIVIEHLASQTSHGHAWGVYGFVLAV